MAESERGWLLEKMHNGNVHYVCADYVLQWTDDPNKALRLSRREDAEALTTIVEDCEKIASHEWPGDSPSDVEQLMELLKAAESARAWICRVSNQYILGADDPHEVLAQLNAALNPSHARKETQA